MQAVLGSGKQASLVPMRLIALPLPPDKVEVRRGKLKRRASRRQEALDPRSVLAAGFMVLVTSLPAAIPAGEICAAYRLRWQVELAFKRLKSLLHIDRLPTRTAAGSLSWLYAHLILVLLTEDICQEFLDSSPEPLASSGRCSLWRAFKLAIDAVLGGLAGLTLAAVLKADPRAHQLLADPKRRRKRQMFSPPVGLS